MPSTPLLGRSDESYELIEKLGQGGFGSVYLARKGRLRKPVAVKLLERAVAPDAEQRLWDEARLLASLHHPGIVAADDWVAVDGVLGLVTEYVEGEDLASCLGAMPPAVVVEVVGQLAWALHAAARAGVVHRDVKPQNVRIGCHGTVKLLDFGIAFAEGDGRASDGPQLLYGTPRFMAPERFRCEFSAASDVFSLGCVLWLGLEGGPFYGAFDRFDALERFTRSDERWGELLGRTTAGRSSPELERLVRGMLARLPEDRPTAAEVGRACEGLLDSWSGRPRLAEWCRQRWPEGVSPPAAAADRTASSLVSAPSPDDEATEVARPERPERPERAARPAQRGRSWGWGLAVGASALLAAIGLVTVAGVAVAVVGLSGPAELGSPARPSTAAAVAPAASLPPTPRATSPRQPPPATSGAGRAAAARSAETARRMIVRHLDAWEPALQACGGSSAGRWLLTFDVRPTGQVARVELRALDHPDPAVERCVSDRVRDWRFDPIALTQPVSRTLRFPAR